MDLGRNQYVVSLELGIFQGRPKSIRPNSETVKIRPMAQEADSTHFRSPEQEQRLSGNGDREAIVVEAGLCDDEGERAYTVYDPMLGEEKYLIYFKRFAGAKTGYGTICRKTICRNPSCRT